MADKKVVKDVRAMQKNERAQKKTAATAAAKAEKPKRPRAIRRPNAKKWLQRIDRSLKLRERFKKESDRFTRYYEGDYYNGKTNRRAADAISVNFVFSNIETITPSIFTGFPTFRVRPRPRFGQNVKIIEANALSLERVLNYYIKKLNVRGELKEVLLDSFFSHTLMELGWETGIEEREDSAMRPDEAAGSEELGDSPGAQFVLTKDAPFVERRDPWDLVLDPDAKRRKKCRWYAVRDVLSYNDFLASDKYTEDAKIAVKPSAWPEDMGSPDDREDEKDGEKEWVETFKIWDRENGKVLIVARGYDKFVNGEDGKGEDWPYDIDYDGDPYPFAIMDAKRDSKLPYSWSEFRAYEAQIKEQNRIRQAIGQHVKSMIPKYMYTKALGDRAKANKLMQAGADEAVMVDNLEAIKPLQHAEVPKDLYQFNIMAREDMANVSGSSDFQGQGFADTATEANILEGRGQARKSYKSKTWEEYVVEVAAKLAMLIQQNLEESVVVDIAGMDPTLPSGGHQWVTISPEDIKGDFFFDIEPGSMEYKNEALRTQQQLKFVELTGNDPNVNRRKLLAKIAKSLDLEPSEVITPEDQLPQPPPPEPNVKVKPIDLEALANMAASNPAAAELLNAFIITAAKQNGVPIPKGVEGPAGGPPAPGPGGPGLPPMPPMDPGMPEASGGGPDLNGGNPNGNPALPPVSGNTVDPNLGGAAGGTA